jgi:hypothetical protein
MSTNILRFTYDRDVVSKTGTIKIYDDVNTLLKTVNSTDSYVTYSPRKVEADISELGITWEKDTTYVITVDAGFMEEVGNNRSPSPAQTINYVTPGDPFVESTVPVNNATNISALTIQLNFDEEVIATTGNFYIYDSLDTLLFTIPVSDSRVTYNVKTVSINLDGLIGLGTTYYIRADLDSLKNGFNFLFQGIDDDSVLKFTVTDMVFDFTLTNPNPNIQFFGQQVAVSSTRIAVASTDDSLTTGGNVPNTVNGVLYLYNTSGELVSTIQDLNSLAPGNPSEFDTFPRQIVMNDQYLAFIAQREDNIIKFHIHNPVNGNLIRTVTLPYLPSGGSGDQFRATSIDIDGDYLVVTQKSRRADVPSLARAYAHLYSISSGTLIRTITLSGLYVEINGTPQVKISGNKYIVSSGRVASSIPGGDDNSIFQIFDVNPAIGARVFSNTEDDSVRSIELNSSVYITGTLTEIKIYNLSNDNLLRTIQAGTGTNLQLSGRLLLNSVQLYNIETGALFKNLSGTYGGTPLTGSGTNALFGNKIAFGMANTTIDGARAERVLVFTNPLP